MDDPLFDPWEEDVDPDSSGPTPSFAQPPRSLPRSPIGSPSAPKWRAPEGAPPLAPRRERPVGTDSRARLAGTAGFLRTMAGPRLEDVALRLQLSRHESVVEDDLEGARPALRLRVLPWRGPFSEAPERGWETLELSLESGPEDKVIVRRWCEATGGEIEDEELVRVSAVGASWLESRVLAFVAAALERA